MLVSVTSPETALRELRSDRLRKFNTLSIRGGGTPAVVLGRRTAIYLSSDWTPELARTFAGERRLPDPIDLPLDAGLLELLPMVSVT